MIKKGSINERIAELMEEEGLNPSSFAKKIDSNRQTVTNIVNGGNAPSHAFMESLLKVFPDLSYDWLMLGIEPKYRIGTTSLQVAQELKTEIIVATQDTSRNITIPVVDQEAAANYLAGYETKSYYESLSPMSMPRHMLDGGQHTVFQVKGHSMEPTFFDSEFVICRKVEKSDWEYINDLDVFVVISRDYGVQLKRVKNRLRSKGFMRFKSDNKAHKDFTLQFEEILELWRFQWKLSPFAANKAEELYKKVDDLEDEVEDMRKILEKIAKNTKLLDK